MSQPLLSSTRTFRIWLYSVTHSTLLLRSVRTDDHATRVDIIFKRVRRIDIPTRIVGIDLRVVDAAKSAAPSHFTAHLADKDQILYSLAGEVGDSFVVASTVAWNEDGGEDDDPSQFSVPRMVW
jgi:hypothetical protein